MSNVINFDEWRRRKAVRILENFLKEKEEDILLIKAIKESRDLAVLEKLVEELTKEREFILKLESNVFLPILGGSHVS